MLSNKVYNWTILIFLIASISFLGCGEQGPVSPESKGTGDEAILAKATKTEFESIRTEECLIDQGDVKISGGTLHIRGAIQTGIAESEEVRVAGPFTIVTNFDLNLTTGNGTGFGTISINPDAVDGTWECTSTGRSTNFLFSGRAVGQGTGDLKGQKIMFSITQRVDLPTIDRGHILNPQG